MSIRLERQWEDAMQSVRDSIARLEDADKFTEEDVQRILGHASYMYSTMSEGRHSRSRQILDSA